MNNSKRLAEMKEVVSRLSGHLDVHKRQIKRTLKSLKKNYDIDSTRAAKDRVKEIEKEIERLTEKSEKLEAQAKELMNEID